jgi:hypothetical protein
MISMIQLLTEKLKVFLFPAQFRLLEILPWLTELNICVLLYRWWASLLDSVPELEPQGAASFYLLKPEPRIKFYKLLNFAQ